MPTRIVSPKHKLKAAGAAGQSVQYHGGPVLHNVEVTTIFWGSAWSTDPLRGELDSFFDFIVGSSLMTQLSEYSVPGMTIGFGQHVQSVFISSEPPNPLDDSMIQAELDSLVAMGTVGQPNANSVYFFFLPSGVTVTLQGASSCQDFCGYHNVSASGRFYAVDTYDDCQGCQFVPGDIVASSTVVASHELSEAITDPNLDAWYDDVSGNEIGDFCEDSTKVITGSIVQLRASGISPGIANTTFDISVNPPTITIDGSTQVNLTVSMTPVVSPPPPPPPPPPGQSWTIQTEWSNVAGACE